MSFGMSALYPQQTWHLWLN